jgi:hypothetical protein
MILIDWYESFALMRLQIQERKLLMQRQAKVDNDERERIEYERSQERNESNALCQSCETLKMQLAIANDEKRSLLNRVLAPAEIEKSIAEETKAVLPTRHQSFAIRRQMLEREDREKAKLLNNQREETKSVVTKTVVSERQSTDDLERELDIVTQERMNQSAPR